MIGKKLIYTLCGVAAALVVTAVVCIPFSTVVKGEPAEEKFVVCFNSQGGTTIDNIEVDANGKIRQPENPILDGYVFDGWFKNESCTEIFDFEKDSIDGNTFLYAKWTPASKLEVKFNTMGGSTIQSTMADRDGLLVQPEDPEKLDFIFAGWYQNEACSEGLEWNFKNDIVTSPMTLYAKWIAVTGYKVSFNTMGGTAIVAVDAPKGGVISAPVSPTRSGYAFAGWYQDEECSEGQEWNFETDKVNGDLTLYAKWTPTGPDTPDPETYTVIFESNGGSPVSSITNVEAGSTISQPKNPTKSGATFGGWYQDEDCTKPWNFETDIVSDNITLYAKWTPKSVDPDPETYTVIFESNGGSPVSSITNVEAGSTISQPKNPTKSGATFGGWYQDEDCTEPWNFDTDVVTGPTTLYAKWDADAFEISFVTEFGIRPDAVQGKKIPDQLAVLSEQGHVFCGWYLDNAFQNKAIAGAAISSDTILYAKWRDRIKYDELLDEKDFVIANDEFEDYKATDRLPEFGSWGTSNPGIYYGTHVGSGSTVQPSETTTYIQMDKGVAELMDTSDGASVQLVLNSGKLSSGMVEGYFEVTLKESGSSWTFFQLYGTAANATDPAKVDEVFGFRTDGTSPNTTIKYRVNKGTSYKDGITPVALSDTTYKVYFSINLELKTLTITINDQPYLTDFTGIQFTSIDGFKFTSSDKGSKTMSVDYLIMTNMNLSVADYKAKMKAQAQADFDALDVKTNYPSSETALTAILTAALTDIDSKQTISDVKKAYEEYVTKLNASILTAQKQKLADELDHYVDSSLYTNEQLNKKELTEAISKGKTDILNASTYNQAVNALNDAKKVIDAIPTDDELIDSYKNTCITALRNYKDIANYSQNINAFRQALTDGELAINKANSIEAIDAALAAAKSALDAIEDDSAYLDSIKARLCKELDDKVNSIKNNELADSKYASYVSQIEAELATGKNNINNAKTAALAQDAKAVAVEKIELILSAAIKTIDEFKEDAIKNLNDYAKKAATGYNDAYLLSNIEDERLAGVAAINAITGTDSAAKDAVVDALEAAMAAIDACIDNFENGVSDAIIKQGQIQLVHYSGVYESAVLEWQPLSGATDYKVYIKGGAYADYTEAGLDICYIRIVDGIYRANLTGLESGVYTFKVVPVIGGKENDEASTICKSNVLAYDRSGYAHFNYTDGVGAYKDNGTLKDNAIVLYVTDDNKNTVELKFGNETIAGIGNILNTVGQECGEAGHEGQCKRLSGSSYYYGIANTNAGILKKLADANIPLVVRFVGCVSNTGLYKQGTFSAASKSLIEGLTEYDTYNYGGSPGDNGHMARMQSAKNVTLEGVGSDAMIDGWGFHFMCQSSNPDYGKNFEVRNLKFINTPEDAIGMEGIQSGSVITASVERCWIHHNEFYGPKISNPAESDKGEGDGSCDFKRGQYLTVSYNYFEGCHKTNLVGSSDSSLQFNLTYHHNYWKLCKARGPLARQANIHMYNNVFEGQTDYAMNTRANAFIFSEYNMFYMCKNPQRVDGGAIKSYHDSFSSTIEGIGTIVSDKKAAVSNPCKYGSIDYSQFELDSKLSYIPTGDYELQESVTDARKVIYAQTGVSKGTYIKPENVTLDDLSYLSSNVTPVTVNTYPTTLTPGKISKTVYAFKLDRMAEVTIDTGGAGILVNQAGECLISGNGSAVVEPGTYIVQAQNFQPGDAGTVTSGTFKDMTISSIQINEHNSAEFDNKLLETYNTLANNIPATITYTDSCYTAIKAAMNAYEALRDEIKDQVSVPYSIVDNARLTYVEAGESYVENLISAIGTVTEDSGPAIASARKAFNDLHTKVPYMNVSNHSVLLAAEEAYRDFAVSACIKSIDAIGEVTIDKKEAIELARAQYELLGDEVQKKAVTNYQKLLDAEKKLADLIALQEINELIEAANSTDMNDLKDVYDVYCSLTADQRALISNQTKKSDLLVAYVNGLIDAIPATVTVSDGDAINAANDAYQILNATEKGRITNYAKLEKALSDYSIIAVESSAWNKQFLDTEFEFTNANTGSTSGSTTVSVNKPTILISKFTVTNLSKIVLSYTTTEKGGSLVKVYYSTDKTNWVQFGSECKNSTNGKAIEHTLVAPGKCINGDVYIKIEGTCSKSDSNAKEVTINALEIFAYGTVKYN